MDVSGKAATGYRNVKAGAADDGQGRPGAAAKLFAVYASVDFIKVVPSPAMSRTGGLGYAVKQLVQFDAVAVSKGADGVPGNADDIEIGRVPAAWNVVELASSNEDHDVDFVGKIDKNGLFTPGDEGPNPKRFMQENNMGDVWVTADYSAPGGEKMSARGYLLATIPLYVQRPVQ